MDPIQNKIITIAGFPWSWKTILSVFFSYFYDRIYANFQIKKNNKNYNTFYDDVSYLETISFEKTKWLIIIDEGWLNANSRRSMSNRNLMFGKLIFLSRKKNCDLVVIWQIEESIDCYFRKLSSYVFLMSSYQFWKKIYFEWSIKKQSAFGYSDIWIRRFDLIKFLKKYNMSYSTLESSVMS